MAKTLKVISQYTNRDIRYSVGNVITVEDSAAAFLLADAPGCFEEVTEEVKAVDVPPVDKMLKTPRIKKGS